jgi:hypothetical protein
MRRWQTHSPAAERLLQSNYENAVLDKSEENIGPKKIRILQRYVIADWGDNDPEDFPGLDPLVGVIELEANFLQIRAKMGDTCYSAPEHLAHNWFKKGGVGHPCATPELVYIGFPNNFPGAGQPYNCELDCTFTQPPPPQP